MRRCSAFLVCCSTLGFLLASGIPAQQSPEANRPVVGLALSGGSALGLAHIGVIRYFEEHRIPIDRIGGTSMGGLVGGLYAAGMNSREITEVAEQADWDKLLDPSTPFSDQPVVDKQEWHRTPGNMTLRFGKLFALPAGLNSGQALSLLLSRTTLPYSNVSDFDQLPTPFRCVATDLVSGEAIVLDKGSLPTAMRATMALPGVFTPVRTGEMVLVDGGVLENIPVEPVRHMGAQIVIAVALEKPKPKPEQLKSLTDVLSKTISVAIAKNEQHSLAGADLVISVNTARFSSTDYNRWEEIIQAGYEAAAAHASDLASLELSPVDWDKFIAKRRARMRSAGDRGRVLAVTSPSASFQKNAQAEMNRTVDNRPVSEDELEKILNGMVAATAVPGASYEWQQDNIGQSGFKVRFADRSEDQVLVRVSALYDVSAGEPTRFELKLSTTAVPKDAYKARILASFVLGYDPGLKTELYKPFGGSQYFVAPQFFVGRMHFNSYNGPDRQSDVRDRTGGAFYAGVGTWRFAQLRLGARAGYDSFSRMVVSNGVTAQSGGFTSPELRWVVNTQDAGGLPTRGNRAEGSTGYFFRENQDYPFFQNEYSGFYPVNQRVTLFAMNHAGTSFGRNLNYFDQFMAGGPDNMAAFRYQEFHGNTIVTAGSGIVFNGHPLPYVSSHPRIALWYEVGRFDLGSQGWQTHQSSSIGVFFPNRVGAAGLELSFDEQGRARFRLMLGSF
ncbi:MAG: patatin-like phospholipase family protein [Terracidiphilus sp.]